MKNENSEMEGVEQMDGAEENLQDPATFDDALLLEIESMEKLIYESGCKIKVYMERLSQAKGLVKSLDHSVEQ